MQVIEVSVIKLTGQAKLMLVSIINDITDVSKERDNLWYAATQLLDGGCAAANNSKVSHSIHWFLYDIQLTHFSVSLNSVRLGVSCVLEDRGASIGSLGFHQIPGHSRLVRNFETDSQWVHWNVKTATSLGDEGALRSARSGPVRVGGM